MVEFRRSFFRQRPRGPGYKWYHVFYQWFFDVHGNSFLFWAIVGGFVTVFPTLYIPVINHKVFKHTGISWEWGIVIVEAILFFVGCEFWKWLKRVWFRRQAAKAPKDEVALDRRSGSESVERDMEKMGSAGLGSQMAEIADERVHEKVAGSQ